MKKKLLALVLAGAMALSLAACGGGGESSGSVSGSQDGSQSQQQSSSVKAGVFWYNFSDAYLTTVRSAMNEELGALGLKENENFKHFDAQTNQGEQLNQINTAITDGYNLLIVNVVDNAAPDAAKNIVEIAKNANVPVIFFNRDFDLSVLQSYEKAAFVGTDPAEAGHMQGKAAGEYIVKNFEKVDLNGDGEISYVMFKGQEGNPEACLLYTSCRTGAWRWRSQ